ncbi:MAG: nucleotidyltransferase domain-containing protein [Oscillospiraceae bacterium]|nr:nucleotidyltransferase domain-containing protein [Oscillospiraceae bacterium]
MSDSIKSELSKYVETIKKLKGIQAIYLFGSYAYGKPNENSDIDLGVVIDDGIRPFDMQFNIYKVLSFKEKALDVVAINESTFISAGKGGFIEDEVKERGLLLYAKAGNNTFN